MNDMPFEGDGAAEEAKALEAARLKAAIDGLMNKAEGRAFLRWLLAQSGAFSAQRPEAGPLAERLIFAEGARLVGMRLLSLIQAANAAHFPTLLTTKEDDDASNGCARRGHSPAGFPAARGRGSGPGGG